MSQAQHISVQMTSVEERLAQKLDELKEDTALVLEHRRKRRRSFELQDEFLDGSRSKRRKSGETDWTPTPRRSKFVMTKAQLPPVDDMVYPCNCNTYAGKASSASSLPLDRTSDEESPRSPLTPLEMQGRQHDPTFAKQLHYSIEQARVLGSTGNLVNARLTKVH
jgi:hypothetical protein